MDFGGAMLELGIALGGGLCGAGVAVFKIGREVERLRQAAEGATKLAEELKVKIEEDAKEDEKSWRDLSYMLGQISVALGLPPEGPPTRPDLPPVRPRLPSRPR